MALGALDVLGRANSARLPLWEHGPDRCQMAPSRAFSRTLNCPRLARESFAEDRITAKIDPERSSLGVCDPSTGKALVVARKHYCIPPLVRVDLDRILNLIRDERYFILHAPRQTGKTSALRALQDLLNSGTQGDYRCLHVNIEAAQAWRENIPQAMAAILQVLAGRARRVLGDDSLDRIRRTVLAEESPGTGALECPAGAGRKADPRPLVLLIDEVDALVGDTLLSCCASCAPVTTTDRMRSRTASCSAACATCGTTAFTRVRPGEPVAGGSAFQHQRRVVAAGRSSSETEVETLLGQHTAETGQQFEPPALERVWKQTAGLQPWLVNALCDEACFESPQGRDRSRPITEDDILAAQEVLIQGRVVHLDQLADKLREERVPSSHRAAAERHAGT